MREKENPPSLSEVTKIGIGVLGYGFMGHVHSHGFTSIPMYYWPTPAVPKKVAICGRTESKVRIAAQILGYEKYYTNFQHLIRDNDVEVVDVCTPHDYHQEQSIASVEAGKHIICEKPVALNLTGARAMYKAAEKAGVKNMIAFNYRFFPAVTLVKRLLVKKYLGQILHFKACFHFDWGAKTTSSLLWQEHRGTSGRGILGGLGSHIADLARFLVGDIKRVSGLMGSYHEAEKGPNKHRPNGDESVFLSTIQFENNAIGTLEASVYATGRKCYEKVEIYGTEGAIIWDLNRLNELQVYSSRDPEHLRGFRTILVLDPKTHPFLDKWYYVHPIGFDRGHLHMLLHFIDCIVNDKDPAPQGATFYDGMKNQEILDAIAKSTKEEKWVNLPL
jgi:predicted dehydrogenase